MSTDNFSTMVEKRQPMMTAEEARQTVTDIKAGITQIGDKLFDLYEREGWAALGYDNWRACVTAEFDFGQSRAYQLLAHAKTVRLIEANSTMVEKPTNERQTRILTDFDDKEKVVIWEKAVKDTGGQPTGQQVKQAASNFHPSPKPTGKMPPKIKPVSTTPNISRSDFDPGPGIEAEFQSTENWCEANRYRYEEAGYFIASPEELAGSKCPTCGRNY